MTKRYALLIPLFMISILGKAQNNGDNVDFQKIHFGFTFQYINTEYKVYKKADWRSSTYRTAEGKEVSEIAGASLNAVSAPKSPGFALGFVSDLKVGTHANLRFTPVLVFGERQLKYDYHGAFEPSYITKTSATTVDMPLGIKLKSDQRGNFRAYILGGVKYSHDITSSKKNSNDGDKKETEKVVRFAPKYFSWETGIGFDLYFEYFKMSPEIKFSQSFGNVLDKTDKPNMYNHPIDKLFLRSFQFSLFFE